MRFHRNVIVIGISIIAVGIVSATALVVTSGRDGASAQTASDGRSVTVDGYATIALEPDSAILHFAIVGEGESEEAARDDAAARAEEVVAALREQGVSEDAITISEFRTTPAGPEAGDDGETGYVARGQVQATLDGVDRAEEILEAVETATGVERAGVEYTVGDTSAAQREAREAALEDARERAEGLAALFGGTPGDVVNVHEMSPPAAPLGGDAVRWSFGDHDGFGFDILEDEAVAGHLSRLAGEIEERFGNGTIAVPEFGTLPRLFGPEGDFDSNQVMLTVRLTVTWALN